MALDTTLKTLSSFQLVRIGTLPRLANHIEQGGHEKEGRSEHTESAELAPHQQQRELSSRKNMAHERCSFVVDTGSFKISWNTEACLARVSQSIDRGAVVESCGVLVPFDGFVVLAQNRS